MTEAERELLCLIIGYRVRTRRKARHLSQSDLANGIGSQSMISLIESGRQLPPADVLRLLANRLEDPVLDGYGLNLEHNNLNNFSISEQNQDDLMQILLSHRGRWYAAHERIASQLSHHYYDTRNFQRVLELCELTIHHMEHGRSLGEAYFFLGSAQLYKSNFEEAEKWLKKSEEYYDHLGDLIRARLCYNLGYVYTYLDVQVRALWYAFRAVDIFHKLNHFAHYGRSLGLLGVVQVLLGRLQEAKENLSLALEIVNRWTPHREDRGRLLVSLAEVHMLLGDTTTAREILMTARETIDPEDHLCLAEVNLFEAQIALTHNDTATAIQSISYGLQSAKIASNPRSLTQLYFLQLNMSKDPTERLRLAREAYNVTVHTNHHILHALASETLANVLGEDHGSESEVKIYLQSALEAYRTYVHKNNMFAELLDYVPIHSSVSKSITRDNTQEVAASSETDASQE